jgi:hypothetical protein
MGFYERRILPKLLDKMMSDEETVRLRKATLAPARGRVLEVGFGTGLNVPHYPSTSHSSSVWIRIPGWRGSLENGSARRP